ncbi:unnamed protein product [Ostreobium quekettii]|uniref:Uncharacterized protein n=1 Tax=Ostreobium quekettii TaxID=121088 RepID=A0A8S1IY38_9CHLO|nr:unnamed protein product [Ostreobium quekettii]
MADDKKSRGREMVTPLTLPGHTGFFSPRELSIQRHTRSDSGADPLHSPGTMRSMESAASTVEDFVRDSLSNLEERLESVLDNVSEELASEVARERQHLMLMQEQVDKQGRMLQHEFGEIRKAMEQERTARALVQQSTRERGDAISENANRWRCVPANLTLKRGLRQCAADRPYVTLPSS